MSLFVEALGLAVLFTGVGFASGWLAKQAADELYSIPALVKKHRTQPPEPKPTQPPEPKPSESTDPTTTKAKDAVYLQGERWILTAEGNAPLRNPHLKHRMFKLTHQDGREWRCRCTNHYSPPRIAEFVDRRGKCLIDGALHKELKTAALYEELKAAEKGW